MIHIILSRLIHRCVYSEWCRQLTVCSSDKTRLATRRATDASRGVVTSCRLSVCLSVCWSISDWCSALVVPLLCARPSEDRSLNRLIPTGPDLHRSYPGFSYARLTAAIAPSNLLYVHVLVRLRCSTNGPRYACCSQCNVSSAFFFFSVLSQSLIVIHRNVTIPRQNSASWPWQLLITSQVMTCVNVISSHVSVVDYHSPLVCCSGLSHWHYESRN